MVSSYSTQEITNISRMDIQALAGYMRGMSLRQGLTMRVELQRGIADLAKIPGTLPYQENLVGIVSRIEKWCRGRFMKDTVRRLVLTNPVCARNKRYAKMLALQEWNSIMERYKY